MLAHVPLTHRYPASSISGRYYRIKQTIKQLRFYVSGMLSNRVTPTMTLALIRNLELICATRYPELFTIAFIQRLDEVRAGINTRQDLRNYAKMIDLKLQNELRKLHNEVNNRLMSEVLERNNVMRDINNAFSYLPDELVNKIENEFLYY